MSAEMSGNSPGRKHTAFLPVRVGRVEAVLLRLGMAAAVLWSVWKPPRHDRMEAPAGLSAWGLDFSFLGQAGVHPWFLGVTAVFGLFYVSAAGRPLRTIIGLAGMTAAHVGYWTLFNSQGNTFHGSQITSLVLLLQLIGAIVMLWRARAGILPSARWPGLDSILLYMSQCAIAAVYVASAITKISRSGGRWMLDSHYFAKSVQRIWRQEYFDSAGAVEFSGVSPLAVWLAEHPFMARLIFGPGFLLELGAFLILLSRRWAFGMGAALIAMHLGIGWIMRLYFPEYEVMLLIFCVNVPFLMAAAAARARHLPEH